MKQFDSAGMDPAELERRVSLFELLFKLQVIALVAITFLVSFSFMHFGPAVIGAYGSPIALMLLAMVFGRSLVLKGRFEAGVLVTTVAIVLTLGFFLALWGTRDTVIFVCIWPVMTSTLLLSPRAGFIVAGVVSLMTVVLATLELVQPAAFPLNPDQILYPPGWHRGAALDVVVSIAIDTCINIVVLFSVAFLSWVLTGSLRSVIDEMKQKVDELKRLSDRNEELASRIHAATAEVEAFVAQQKRGASQSSSAVGQIGASLRHLLEASRELAQKSSDVASNAQRNLVQGEEVIVGIEVLQERTQQIDEVVDSIADVGNKSEVLALNAALEGVKAGESGQGFTIVANQMQRLAEEVLATLPDVTGHVASIRGATEELRLSTHEGSELSRKTAELTGQISQFTQRQERGTEEVSQAVNDIERITCDAVESTEHLLEAMGELMELAEELVSHRDLEETDG